MAPIDQVEQLYELYDCERSFGEDLAAHLANGFVISSPGCFAMARGVNRSASPEAINNPWHAFARSEQDTWYVYAFAGASRNILSFIPYPLTWLAWERVGKSGLRFLDFNRFVTRCAQMTHS